MPMADDKVVYLELIIPVLVLQNDFYFSYLVFAGMQCLGKLQCVLEIRVKRKRKRLGSGSLEISLLQTLSRYSMNILIFASYEVFHLLLIYF